MRGHVDRFDTTIAGWAFDPVHPGQSVEISVSHGEHELYRCKADLFRSDLVSVIGSGNHGFSFDPENIEGFNGSMMLTVTAHGTTSFVMKEEDWKPRRVVAEGVDEWLFLQNDSNNVTDRMAGLNGMEPSSINESAMTFVARNAMLEKLGIPYHAIIVPEKNVVCAKYWPGLFISESRPVPQIISKAQDFGCRITYPISEFLQNPDRYFLKTDTHLTAAGCDELLSILSLQLPDFFSELLPIPRKENTSFCGDLGAKLMPPRTECATEFIFPSGNNHTIPINQVNEALEAGTTLRGNVVFSKNSSAPNGKLILFGTSSAFHFLPAVSQYFTETLFIWENTLDYQLIKKFQPDCVLWLATERFLPTACNDMFGLPDTVNYLSGRI